jgi:cytochrome c oxidase subunit 4
MKENTSTEKKDHKVHVVPYKEHFGTWLALIVLTVMTVTVSVFGAELYTLSVLTAMLIASTKALIVAYYFMHLKYDMKMYQVMIGIVLLLFVVFIVLTLFDYIVRF